MSPSMMCFGSKQVDPAAQKNEEIEKQIRNDKRRLEREVKVLLLGAGESGKSTILKQMRLIHAGGFTSQDRNQWRVVIHMNLMHAFQVIFRAMTDQNIRFDNDADAKEMEWIRTQPDRELAQNEPLPPRFLQALKCLWKDSGVQKAIEQGNEYALHDNLTYFFLDIDRFFDPKYVPTDQDILRARLRTTGISETTFDLGNLYFRMFDVGGQRSERKKWIHCFDNVQVVMFLAAISGYDHVLVEDANGNQMREALMLFETIANSHWFEKSALILFLNKIDLFKEKIQSGSAPISGHFPDYSGPPRSVEAGQEYFADRFRSLVKKPGKEIYIHYTNATDTDLLKKTMDSVQDMIVQRNLKQLIL